MMVKLKINSKLAELVEETTIGNCDRCGIETILFSYEVWRYCERCCEHSEKIEPK